MSRNRHYSHLMLLLRKWKLKKMKVTPPIVMIDSDPGLWGLQAHARVNRRNSLGKTTPHQSRLFPRTESWHLHVEKEATLWAEGRAFPLKPSPSLVKPGSKIQTTEEDERSLMKSSTLGKGREKKERERMRRKTRKKRTQGRRGGGGTVPDKYFLLINSILPLEGCQLSKQEKFFTYQGKPLPKRLSSWPACSPCFHNFPGGSLSWTLVVFL